MTTATTSYEQIEAEMKLWRAGAIPMPKSYLTYHKELALRSLDLLAVKYSLKVHRNYYEDDGWLDGMKNVQAIVEDKQGKLHKIKWHDSHAAGSWFVYLDGGGWGQFAPML